MADSREEVGIVLRLRDRFTAGLSGARAKLATWSRRVRSSVGTVTRTFFNMRTAVLGIGAALTVGFFGKLVADTTAFGDKVEKLSRQLGVSTEFITETGHAAALQSISFEDWAKSIDVAAKNLGQLSATGTGEAGPALERLGGGLREAVESGQSIEQLFPRIVQQFQQLGSQTEKTAIASILFGRAGRPLVNLLDQTADSLEETREEARKLGIVWSREDATSAADFGDSVTRLTTSLRGLRDSVIKPLLPLFEQATEALTEFVVENRPKVLRFFADMLDATADVGIGLEALIRNVASSTIALADFLPGFEDPRKQIEYFQERIERTEAQIKRLEGTTSDFDATLLRAAKQNLPRWRAELERARRAAALLDDSLEGAVLREGSPVIAAIRAATARLREAAAGETAAAKGATELGGELSALEQLARGAALGLGLLEDQALAWQEAARSIVEDVRVEQINVTLGRTNDLTRGLADGLIQLDREWSDTYGNARAATLALGDALSDNVATAFTDIVTGTKKAKDALRDWARSSLQDISRVINRLLTLWAIQQVTGFISNAIGSFRVANPGAGAVSAGRLSGGTGAVLGATAGAGPAGALGGFLSGLGFQTQFASAGLQSGGIAGPYDPHLIGEGRTREAAVPLPDGRSIPVTLHGGGRGQSIVYVDNRTIIEHVDATDAKSFDRQLAGGISRNPGLVGFTAGQQYQDDPTVRRLYR